MNKKLNYSVFAITPLLCFVILAADVAADDPENVGSRLEDDAWYDVSEWFDGNDYNPTDEAIGRWDDERFDYYDKQTSTDTDNDTELVDAEEFYGEDWDDGYGVYTDRDRDGFYESYSRYYDTDGDYLNDSYVTYQDDDGDGMYDTYDFSQIAGEHAVHRSNVAQSAQNGLSGKAVRISGTIKATKFVRRLGGLALLLDVKASEDTSLWVDMGSNSAFQLFEGDSLTAYGPIAKAGNKKVLVATAIEAQGKQVAVKRTGRKYSGTIESMRTATVQGDKRTVAKLRTPEGKMLTVDMGAVEQTKSLKRGDKLSVTGVPVKVGDRVILIADTTTL